jgi:hypothetical protein
VFVGTPYGQNPQILVTDGIGSNLRLSRGHA